ARLPCPCAWTWARTCVPRQSGAGHGVQNPRPGRREAAQGALLFGAPRPRLRGKNGRSAVRLSPGKNFEEGGGGLEEQVERPGGGGLLRREAGDPGDRDDGP